MKEKECWPATRSCKNKIDLAQLLLTSRSPPAFLPYTSRPRCVYLLMKRIGLAQLLLTSRLPPAFLPFTSQVPPARVVYTAGVEKMRTPSWEPVHQQAEGLHPGNGLIAKVHGTATRIVLMQVKIS